MPNYTIRVTYTYPVSSPDPKGALGTVPLVTKVRLPMVLAEGLAEILDSETKVVILTAKLTSAKKAVVK